jgi:hypothetical protein
VISFVHKHLNSPYSWDYYYYKYSALGPVRAGTRAQSGDWYGSGTLHPGQSVRGSLPLLSPIPGICLLKISVCCRYVIKDVKIGCCVASTVVWKVLTIGHNDATISCLKTRISEVYIAGFHF